MEAGEYKYSAEERVMKQEEDSGKSPEILHKENEYVQETDGDQLRQNMTNFSVVKQG